MEELGELRVGEPQRAHAVAHAVARRVGFTQSEVAVEIAEQSATKAMTLAGVPRWSWPASAWAAATRRMYVRSTAPRTRCSAAMPSTPALTSRPTWRYRLPGGTWAVPRELAGG